MHQTLKETKVFRDPIHGYIHVDLSVVWELIDTYEFQRLRRIHQLGGTYMVYHTAEHSRFSHSLGVYEIIRRMVCEVSSIKASLTEYEKVTVMLAGLLHDLGHGPFSHAFESIAHIHHEEMTIRIIEEDTQVHRILMDADSNLPHAIAQVISHTHCNPLLSQLVSGQLDADRMDYLLRDSYFTGTSYGNFDLERILRSLRVIDNKLVVKESGIHTVEDYIMSRYHMYWQVYYHPLSRSYEALLVKLFLRLFDLYQANPQALASYPMFLGLLEKNQDIASYLELDESAMLYGIQLLSKHDDAICQDLARRILCRDLFAVSTMEEEADVLAMEANVRAWGYDPHYYFHQDKSSQIPYLPYITKGSDVIVVLKDDQVLAELSDVSMIVSSIVQGKMKNDRRMFFPKECRNQKESSTVSAVNLGGNN